MTTDPKLSITIQFPAHWRWDKPEFKFVVREGFDLDGNENIVAETMDHLKHALTVLREGGTDVADGYDKRETYKRPTPKTKDHGLSLVQAFGNSYLVMDPNTPDAFMIPYSINHFNETTSARDIVDAVHAYVAMNGMWEKIKEVYGNDPNFRVAKPEQQKTQPEAPPKPEPTPQGENLDEWFPRDEQKPPATNGKPNGKPQTTPLYRVPKNKEEREQFERYVGSEPFAFKIRGLKLQKVNDVALFVFFGEWSGGVSKYPIYGIAFFPQNDYNKENHADFIKWLREQNPVAGQMIEVNGRWVGRINESNGKTYWNLIKFDPTPAQTAEINWQVENVFSDDPEPDQPAPEPQAQTQSFDPLNDEW